MQVAVQTNRISMKRGESCSLKILVYSEGSVYSPTPNDSFRLTVKRGASADEKSVLTKSVSGSSAEANYITFSFLPSDTISLEARGYVYDIWLINGDSQKPVVPVSTFIVEESLLSVLEGNNE